MRTRVQKATDRLAIFQVVDAVACAIPLQYIKDDLDHVGCPESLQRVLPVIKGAAAGGLVLGRSNPGLRRLTAGCLVAYYAIAVGFHVKAGDPPLKSAPAGSLAAASAYVALSA